MPAATFTARDRRLANLIWREGPLARAELHSRSGVHPNQVGISVDRLLKLGFITEGVAKAEGRGRPSVPLEVSAAGKEVLGVSISNGRIETARLDLRGNLLDTPRVVEKADRGKLIKLAAAAVKRAMTSSIHAVGVSMPGLVDPESQSLLFSSTDPQARDVSLQPIFEEAGPRQIVINNDQHALAARWLLTHRVNPSEDLLLVGFDDGRMGAATLAEGRPTHGCVMSANELGHTCLGVDAPTCYCGQVGCIERIFSSEFVAYRGVSSLSLADLARSRAAAPASFDEVVGWMGLTLANAVNFARPHRLILASPFAGHLAFADALTARIRQRILPALAERVRIEWWDTPVSTSAENAGWLAIASIFYDGWFGPIQVSELNDE
jgi:predicted NBD/HSP70 family sugar kinase